MRTPPPNLSPTEAEALASHLYGITGRATPLPGERDQNFLVEEPGRPPQLLKVSNPGEPVAVVEMQLRALGHLARVDPSLPVPRVRPTLQGSSWARLAGGGQPVRMLSYLPGRQRPVPELSRGQLVAVGALAARVGAALCAFFDPAADQEIIWNPRRLSGVRELLPWLAAPAGPLVERALDLSQGRLEGRLPRLRSQVIHNDLSASNLAFDESGDVSGVLDFGDLCHGPLVQDLAVAAEGALEHPLSFEALGAMVAGYRAITPLQEEELEALPDLLMARWATLVAVSAWRASAFPASSDYVSGWRRTPELLLAGALAEGESRWRGRVLSAIWAAAAHAGPQGSLAELAEARQRLLGPALSPLSYRQPLHLVRGSGAHLFDREGREYLDAYNNVPVLGHGNPAVAAAEAAQARLLNTNTRYLFGAVLELAQRLQATMPEGLDTVMLVNSGSEANDLAWRLAQAFSGARGAVVTRHAYHGMTAALADFSPGEWRQPLAPSHVAMIDPPDGFRGPHRREQPGWADRYLEQVEVAVGELAARGERPAAMLIDSAFTSEGVIHPPPGYLPELYRRWRRGGGLVIADEVQTGLGRLGASLWGFQHHRALPDIVTIGKPLGNGYPVAAVVTRREIVAAMARRTEWFSTFGGNPVACRTALAVLDRVDRPDFLARVAQLGALLAATLGALAEHHPEVGEVRCLGLLAGVELVQDPESRRPHRELAAAVVEGMRSRGVLVGRAGRDGNVIKVRPPLVVSEAEVLQVARAADAALASATKRSRGWAER